MQKPMFLFLNFFVLLSPDAFGVQCSVQRWPLVWEWHRRQWKGTLVWTLAGQHRVELNAP